MKCHLATVSLATLLFCGCMGPPTPGEEQPFASVCDAKNEGQRVAVRGYFRLPFSNEGTYGATLRLFDKPSAEGAPISVLVPFGTEPHHMATLPTSYTHDDLELYLVDGGTAGTGDEVKVSGKVYFGPEGFACALENPYFESAN
jgi:hypothetical protein